MWIGNRHGWIIIYGVLLVLAGQLTLVFAGCAIQPDANGHVDIPSSWTSIGSQAFYNCIWLETVSIPNSVTSIGDGAFRDCSSLKTVSIPDSVKSIGNTAFYGCFSLKTVSIPDSVKSIDKLAFAYCSSLETVRIPDLSVTSFGDRVFADCNKLSICKIEPDYNGAVSIPDTWTTLNYAFYNCKSLKIVSIPDSVTSIGGSAFAGCTSMKTVSIPDSVTSIGNHAFHGCSSLETVSIPDSVTTIGERAFWECSSLETVSIPDSVKSIGGGAFQSCTSLEAVRISNSVTSIGTTSFHECSSLKTVSIPDSVKSIGWSAFSRCSSLKTAIIPDSVTRIATYAFSGCSSLETVSIGNSSSLEILQDAFRYATKIVDMAFGTQNKITFHSSELGRLSLNHLLLKKSLSAIIDNPFTKKYNCIDGLCGCVAGYGNSLSATSDYFACHRCVSQHYQYTISQSACKACEEGSYANNNGSARCTACGEGKIVHFPTKGNGECRNCPTGKYGTNGHTCLDCPPNSYASEVGSGECTKCPVGRHGASGNNTDRSSKDTACPLCVRGKFVNIEGQGQCFDCPPGSFCGKVGMNFSVPCPSGKYTDESKQHDCRDCPAGRFQTERGSAKCSFCPKGTSSDKTGVSSMERLACTACPAGSYASQNGSATCQECGKDTYTNTVMQSTCIKCKKGMTTLGTNGTVDGVGATSCVVLNTPCDKGQYRDADTGECYGCKPGRYSSDGRGTECLMCPRNTYSQEKNSSECELCPAGSHGIGGKTVERSSEGRACTLCVKGKYVNIAGASECINCPPGSSCGKEGMKINEPCAAGRYTDQAMQESCTDCPRGRYQNLIGSAKCSSCAAGTYNDQQAAINASACVKCKPGKFANNPGFAECTTCSEGHIQPEKGAVACNRSCKAEQGRTKTSNEDHTSCVVDSAFNSKSVVETLFDKGIALYATAGIAVVFVALVSILQYKKTAEKYKNKVSSLPNFQIVLKSFLPGFSFGSDLFLIIGMAQGATYFAVPMGVFRLLHMVAGIIVIISLYGPLDRVKIIERYLSLKDASSLREKTEKDFCLENMPLVGALLFLSTFDVTMLQFVPWKASRFFNESKGYPALGLMRFSMIIKVVQSLVSVVCQSTYLFMNVDLSDPTVKVTTKILFIGNIGFSFANLVMSLILLVMKQELLATVQEEEDKKEAEEKQKKVASIDPADLAVIANPMMRSDSSHTPLSQQPDDKDKENRDVEARDATMDEEEGDDVTAQIHRMSQEAVRMMAGANSAAATATADRPVVPAFLANVASLRPTLSRPLAVSTTSESYFALRKENQKLKGALEVKDEQIQAFEYEKRVLQQRVQDLESQGTQQHQEKEEEENL